MSVKIGNFKFDAFDMFYSPDGALHINKDYDNPALQAPEICESCGGECCKRCGCFLSPDDFAEVTYEDLKAEIQKGYIAIDHLDLDQFYMEGFARILRVRNVKDPICVDIYHRPPSQCILLGEHGCKLDWEHRPAGGKLLEPRSTGYCYAHYDASDCVREWKPYQRLLARLAKEFEDVEISCTL